MTICALTFDLDDTLWELRPVMERAERETLDFVRREIPGAEQYLKDREDLWRERKRLLAEQPSLACDLSRWRLLIYEYVMHRAGLSGAKARQSAERVFELYIHWRNRVELYDGVEDALQQLGSRFRLGSLTNGNADLNRIGIAHLFDFTLSAKDIGKGKPAPEIFQAAAERAGCAPEEIVHLGDCPERDVAGARDAGMRALWFNPSGLPWSGPGRSPAQLCRWEDLPGLLDRGL